MLVKKKHIFATNELLRIPSPGGERDNNIITFQKTIGY